MRQIDNLVYRTYGIIDTINADKTIVYSNDNEFGFTNCKQKWKIEKDIYTSFWTIYRISVASLNFKISKEQYKDLRNYFEYKVISLIKPLNESNKRILDKKIRKKSS